MTPSSSDFVLQRNGDRFDNLEIDNWQIPIPKLHLNATAIVSTSWQNALPGHDALPAQTELHCLKQEAVCTLLTMPLLRKINSELQQRKKDSLYRLYVNSHVLLPIVADVIREK